MFGSGGFSFGGFGETNAFAPPQGSFFGINSHQDEVSDEEEDVSNTSNLSFQSNFQQPQQNVPQRHQQTMDESEDGDKKGALAIAPGNRVISNMETNNAVAETDTNVTTQLATFIQELRGAFKQLQQLYAELAARVANSANSVLLQSSFNTSMMSDDQVHGNQQKLQLLLNQTSKSYRLFLAQYEQSVSDDNLKDKLAQQRFVIHLFEILHFSVTYVGTTITPEFILWLRSSQPAQLNDPEIHKSKPKYNNDNWWSDIFTLLLHGEVKVVSDLMKNYLDESKGDEYKELHQKLQQMPLMKPDDDRDDFKRRFNAYQKSCNVLLNRFNTINPDDEHPLTILKILIGDTETLQQCALTWSAELLGRLIFKHPTVSKSDLTHICGEVGVTYKDALQQLPTLEKLPFLAVSLDSVSLLTKVCASWLEVSEDKWFMAHLTDLVYHSVNIKTLLRSNRQPNDELSLLREQYIVEYIQSLPNQDMWSVSLDYLESTLLSSQRESYILECIRQILSHVRLDTTKTLQKCVEFCKKHSELTDVAKSLNVTYGMKFIKNSYPAHAILYFLRADDTKRIARVVDKIVVEYLENQLNPGKDSEAKRNSALQNLRAIANIVHQGLHMNEDAEVEMVSFSHLQKLLFVHHYVTLLDGIEAIETGHASQEHLQKVAQLVMTLIVDTGRSAFPRRFWLLLLTHAVGLLEQHNVAFSNKQLSVMMNCLVQLEVSHRNYLQGIDDSHLDVIRLSLSRNMARAMMYIK